MTFAELLFVVDIPGFDDYGISEDGRVYSWRWKRFVKIGVTKGYNSVMLVDNQGERFKKEIHRLLAVTYIPNTDNHPIVDHINRDSLDNSISNLRWVTYNQSIYNRSKFSSTTSSKYIGVHWYNRDSKWKATVMIDNKRKYLGLFNTEEEAALAYNNFISIHRGEFANPNIIQSDED
jgi:hypothetical protein